VSIRIHRDSDAAVAEAGIATGLARFSLLVLAVACSQAL